MLPGEVDGRRFLRALGRFGWRVRRVNGSHRVLESDDGRILVVAFHSSLSRPSVLRALREAGIQPDEFERLL